MYTCLKTEAKHIIQATICALKSLHINKTHGYTAVWSQG